jgi:hypothetical protein
MAVFRNAAERQFQRRVAEYLRSHYGDVLVEHRMGSFTIAESPEPTLGLFVSWGMAKAQKYGIRHQAGIAAFIALLFLVGPTFDENPAVNAELNHKEVPDHVRMDHVCAIIPDSVWANVRACYDAAGWPSALASVSPKNGE